MWIAAGAGPPLYLCAILRSGGDVPAFHKLSSCDERFRRGAHGHDGFGVETRSVTGVDSAPEPMSVLDPVSGGSETRMPFRAWRGLPGPAMYTALVPELRTSQLRCLSVADRVPAVCPAGPCSFREK